MLLRFLDTIAGRQLNNLRSIVNFHALVPVFLLTILLVANTSSSSASTISPAPALAGATVRFAALGDYGANNSDEQAVASLINSWSPDFIITLGDNNYPSGASSTIDDNIGKYFHDYIYPYIGSFTPGSANNRFFPALGNHDWSTAGAVPYLNYFALPNNERYYSFTEGPIEFFVMDSDSHEPDGITVTSAQAAWLHQRLTASTAVWKIVYFHHPPYSSGATHGSNTALQWPFQQWGASAVLSGHEHDYERILHDGIPYMVNGLGGESVYSFGTPVTGSQIRFNATFGAQLIEADINHITFQFYSIAGGGTLIDSYTVNAGSASPTNTPTVIPTTDATNTPVPTTKPTNTLAFTTTPLPTNTPAATSTSTNPQTITLNAVADSYVSDSSPDSNYGISTTLRTDNSPIQRSYLRFNVPTLSGNVISATLRIYANSAVSIGYTVHTTTTAWGETDITFNNAPAFGAGISNSGPITANTWSQVNVTGIVTGIGQYDFVIDTANSTATSLSSREGANPPQLVINTDGGNIMPTATISPTDTLIPVPTATPTRTFIPTMTITPSSTPCSKSKHPRC